MTATFDDLPRIEAEARERLAKATTVEELRAAETESTGKVSELTGLGRLLGPLSPEEKRTHGQALNEVRQRLTAEAVARREELEASEYRARLEADRLDLTEVLPGPPTRGHLHLVTQTRDELEDVFVGMGFTVAEGPEVETDWHNFEALNFPPGHPARNAFDTLYLDYGPAETTLIRTHTSPVQIRVMQTQRPPIYSIMPGRVYRKDTPDARHLPNFSQLEGLVVDHGITFGDLAGTIDTFTKAYYGPGIEARLRPAYFPFTEPSAEFEVTCAICQGSGCRTCSDTGWIELGGCGMVHPNVLLACDLDPEEWSGFAFGFGIDRLAQMRYSIEDMRVMGDNDLRFLSQF